ncbi:hypothetical protein Esti_002813 [Eimeria stiedai]
MFLLLLVLVLLLLLSLLLLLIKPVLRIGEQQLFLDWARGQVFDRAVAQTFHSIVSSNPMVRVTATKETEEVLPMPQALNTVSLLKSASQRLGLGPHHAMQIAERLYLGGFITYPRTETNSYPPSFDLNGAVMQQTNNPHWGTDARQILTKGLARPRSGTDAGDHPPITPVRSATESEVGGGDSWRLYELVCRSFLASVAGNCKFKRRTVSFEASKEEFSASSKICVDPGFSTVLRQTEVRDTLLPDLKPGDTIPIENVGIEEKVTSPPPYLSESDLLGLLEKHRIGTDASMASHINNICERNYVSLVGGRRLQPTKLGVCLVHGYMAIDSELVLPFVRASIEQLVDVIAKGKANREAVVVHSLKIFKAKFSYFTEKVDRMDALFDVNFTALAATGSPLSRCGRCNRYMHFIPRRPSRLHCRTCDVTLALYKELKCPLDGFELLLSVNSGGKCFSFCPLCYNDPPFEVAGSKSMSCVECLHPSCRFSINAIGVTRCPQENCSCRFLCAAVCVPQWRLDCTGCRLELLLFEGAFSQPQPPAAAAAAGSEWQQEAEKVAVTQDECESCGSMKLDVVFSKANPLKDGTTERQGCVLCDPVLNELVSTRLGQLSLRRVRVGRGRGRRGRGRGGRKPIDPKLSFDMF